MGRVTQQQAAENRERVVETAARLFRERGLDGVGIAEVMAEAGLTHGGFYRQFGSKETLAGEACAQSMQGGVQHWRDILTADLQAGHQQAGARAIVDAYLQRGAATRCPMPMLAGDVGREPAGSPVRQAYTDGVREFAAVLGSATGDAGRSRALLAAMVGAVVIARAVNDDVLAAEIMEAVRSLASTPWTGNPPIASCPEQRVPDGDEPSNADPGDTGGSQ